MSQFAAASQGLATNTPPSFAPVVPPAAIPPQFLRPTVPVAPPITTTPYRSPIQSAVQASIANARTQKALSSINPGSTSITDAVVSGALSLQKRVHDGKIMRWALMWLFITAIGILVCVLQMHNATPTSTCWSTASSEYMVGACVTVTLTALTMLAITFMYFRAQPLAQGAKRSFFYPPFVFFAFLTLVTVVSWIMIVDVTAKARASTANTGTANACVSTTDYNAGIAGALMTLVVCMLGTIGAYHWSK